MNKIIMKKIFVIQFIVLVVVACNGPKNATKPSFNLPTKTIDSLPANISLNGKLFSAMFQQKAAEYRALCFQAYNMARMRIDTYVPQTNKPLVLITDIDETILDNSPYAVKQAYSGNEYTSNTWYEWTDKAAADTMPGAASFLNYAASKGLQIFYVTNREDRERESTVENLKKFNLPNADLIHLYTRTNTSSKEARRLQILERYEVVLFMGDNLADLHKSFDIKKQNDREVASNNLANEFGKKYIVFPNVNYGDWELAIYQSYGLSQAQKDSTLKAVLKSY
jgi:5'-nucleotidase (lipoprotein e(P4) family)